MIETAIETTERRSRRVGGYGFRRFALAADGDAGGGAVAARREPPPHTTSGSSAAQGADDGHRLCHESELSLPIRQPPSPKRSASASTPNSSSMAATADSSSGCVATSPGPRSRSSACHGAPTDSSSSS
jgi:hypothetical protein